MKVLFMSGYTDDAISVTGAPNEPAQFILKPFSPDELAGKVRQCRARNYRPLDPGSRR